MLSSRNGKRTPPTVEKQTPVASAAPKASVATKPPVAPPEPMPPSEFEEIRNRIDASLAQMAGLLKAIKAPLPTGTGDGSALTPEKKTGLTNAVKTIITDFSKLGITSIEKVSKMGLMLKAGEDVDDKEYLMEYLVQVSREIGRGWPVTDAFIGRSKAPRRHGGNQDH